MEQRPRTGRVAVRSTCGFTIITATGSTASTSDTSVPSIERTDTPCTTQKEGRAFLGLKPGFQAHF